MPRAREKAVVASLMFAVWVARAAGGDYSDPAGFSLTYPAGWVLVPGGGKALDLNTCPPEIQAWLKKNNVNMAQVSMVVIRQAQTDFLENVNVVVDRQQISVDESSVKKLLDMVPQHYRSMGATMADLEGHVRKVGTHEAIVLDYVLKVPAMPGGIRQRQVHFPGGGNTYIVTCTARADTFANHSQAFDAMLTSFKVPAPVASGFDWSGVLRSIVIGGVVGAVVGGCGVIIAKLTGAKKPKPLAGSQENQWLG